MSARDNGNEADHDGDGGHDHDHNHDHKGVEPITDRVHENSWSANLEQPAHADDPDLVIQQAVDAVEHTASGHHVNLVTHGDLGHPETYLHEGLDDRLDDATWSYVQQCGCGGHVTRVQVE